jgi:hypothetical protein
MSDDIFARIRSKLADILEDNPKAHADVATAKVAAEAILDEVEINKISDEAWAFLTFCAASDVGRCL